MNLKLIHSLQFHWFWSALDAQNGEPYDHCEIILTYASDENTSKSKWAIYEWIQDKKIPRECRRHSLVRFSSNKVWPTNRKENQVKISILVETKGFDVNNTDVATHRRVTFPKSSDEHFWMIQVKNRSRGQLLHIPVKLPTFQNWARKRSSFATTWKLVEENNQLMHIRIMANWKQLPIYQYNINVTYGIVKANGQYLRNIT